MASHADREVVEIGRKTLIRVHHPILRIPPALKGDEGGAVCCILT